MPDIPPEPRCCEASHEPEQLVAGLRKQLEAVRARLDEYREQMQAGGLIADPAVGDRLGGS